MIHQSEQRDRSSPADDDFHRLHDLMAKGHDAVMAEARRLWRIAIALAPTILRRTPLHRLLQRLEWSWFASVAFRLMVEMISGIVALWVLDRFRLTRWNGSEPPISDKGMSGNSVEASIMSDMLAELLLPEIQIVIFYKRDDITTDLICCAIEATDRVWPFREEADGWKDLTAYLARLPGFGSDWYADVVNPPFAARDTVAHRRRWISAFHQSQPIGNVLVERPVQQSSLLSKPPL